MEDEHISLEFTWIHTDRNGNRKKEMFDVF